MGKSVVEKKRQRRNRCQEMLPRRRWGSVMKSVTSVQPRQMSGQLRLALQPHFNTHSVWAQAQGQDLQET